MRKLTPLEQAAVHFLLREGPCCPGDGAQSASGQIVKSVLDSLVKKRRATVTDSDDGPVYTISAIGRAEIAE